MKRMTPALNISADARLYGYLIKVMRSGDMYCLVPTYSELISYPFISSLCIDNSKSYILSSKDSFSKILSGFKSLW
jgi:hypothetical protein